MEDLIPREQIVVTITRGTRSATEEFRTTLKAKPKPKPRRRR